MRARILRQVLCLKAVFFAKRIAVSKTNWFIEPEEEVKKKKPDNLDAVNTKKRLEAESLSSRSNSQSDLSGSISSRSKSPSILSTESERAQIRRALASNSSTLINVTAASSALVYSSAGAKDVVNRAFQSDENEYAEIEPPTNTFYEIAKL